MVGYGFLMLFVPQVQFLNAMAICFVLCLAVMTVMTLLRPLPQPIVFQANTTIALESCGRARVAGLGVIAIVLLFYVVFSPWGIAR
jgi:SSS family solute:Na+ symporter